MVLVCVCLVSLSLINLVNKYGIAVSFGYKLQVFVFINIIKTYSGISINREVGNRLSLAIKQVNFLGLQIGYRNINFIVYVKNIWLGVFALFNFKGFVFFVKLIFGF